MNAFKYTILLVTFLLAFGCTNPPDYPDEPVIEYIGINTNTFVQGIQPNSPQLEIVVSFTDGDGDIGDENNQANFFLVDSRDNFQFTRSIPFVPEQGTGNGISGEITLRINTALGHFCCFYPTGQEPCTPSTQFPTDTLTYTLHMMDRSGKVSNSVVTEPIYLLCN